MVRAVVHRAGSLRKYLRSRLLAVWTGAADATGTRVVHIRGRACKHMQHNHLSLFLRALSTHRPHRPSSGRQAARPEGRPSLGTTSARPVMAIFCGFGQDGPPGRAKTPVSRRTDRLAHTPGADKPRVKMMQCLSPQGVSDQSENRPDQNGNSTPNVIAMSSRTSSLTASCASASRRMSGFGWNSKPNLIGNDVSLSLWLSTSKRDSSNAAPP